MTYIRQEHLEFLQEAKQAFTDNARMETYRNADDTFIALRQGQDRNCIEVFALTPGSLFFENIMDKSPRLVVFPDKDVLPPEPAGNPPPNGNEQTTRVVTFKGITIHYIPHEWDGFEYTVRATVEATCAEIYEHCVQNGLSEFNYNLWPVGK